MDNRANWEKERKNVIPKIKEGLEKEGFKTSWRDPFLDWMQGVPLNQSNPEGKIGDSLYILEPPVPKIVPFDLATVSLRIDHDRIFFELSLYYCRELEDIVEADAINEIFDRHAIEWIPKIHGYFNDISNNFSLQWDTEYDEYIEDSLYGNFPVACSDQNITLMQAIKRCWLEWKRDRE